MKFILLLACLCLYVATLEAQLDLCSGSVPRRDRLCFSPKDEGRNNTPFCARRSNARMWWFDHISRSCKTLSYKGCGGNNNRYCTFNECHNKCVRRPRP